MSNSVGYIVNIPLYFSGNTVALEENIHKILDNQLFQVDRRYAVVIGLNQKEGTVSEQDNLAGVEKAQAIVQTRLAQVQSKIDVQVISYSWEVFGEQRGPNYAEIRNQLFKSKVNDQIYSQYKAEGLSRIFYLTLDPDTQVSEGIFDRVEQETANGPAPLVMVGSYQFTVEDTKLIMPDGSLNWEGYIAAKESEYEQVLKQRISEYQFAFVKYPYISISNEDFNHGNNLLALQKLRKRATPALLDSLDRLIKLYESASDSISPQVKRSILELEQEIGLDKLNLSKTVLGDEILYPPEPILFITLFQRNEGNECDFWEMTQKSNFSIWGERSHICEGEALIINVRKVWRENNPSVYMTSSNKRKYVKFSFTYSTNIPDRALRIATDLRNHLPRDIERLKIVLQKRTLEEKLKTHLKAIFSSRGMSALSNNFIDQRKRALTGLTIKNQRKDARFSPRTGNLLAQVFQDYVKSVQSIYIEMMIQQMLRELNDSIISDEGAI